jgi:hypothetical protein
VPHFDDDLAVAEIFATVLVVIIETGLAGAAHQIARLHFVLAEPIAQNIRGSIVVQPLPTRVADLSRMRSVIKVMLRFVEMPRFINSLSMLDLSAALRVGQAFEFYLIECYPKRTSCAFLRGKSHATLNYRS